MPIIKLFGFPFGVPRRRVRRVPGATQYRARKEEARALVHTRLAHWQRVYPFAFGQVRIKNTRRMWGSCSSKKNLNFNWRVVLLTPELVDYVVLHELCHTVHLNHSQVFWDTVAQFQPGWRSLRAQLRGYNMGIV